MPSRQAGAPGGRKQATAPPQARTPPRVGRSPGRACLRPYRAFQAYPAERARAEKASQGGVQNRSEGNLLASRIVQARGRDARS